MSTRDAFTAEEWQTLEYAPLWIFDLVAGADGKIDAKEEAALAKELQQAARYRDPLVSDILSDVAEGFKQLMPEFRDDRRDIHAGLRDVADVLDGHPTPEAAERFKRALLSIGFKVAEASGPLFRSKASAEEWAALMDAAASLRLASPSSS